MQTSKLDSKSPTSEVPGSAIYEGIVRHRRNIPKVHEFDFRFFMLLLDLDEIESRFGRGWVWSTRRLALCRFREADHLKEHLGSDPKNRPSLRQRALQTLNGHNVHETVGPIKLLTQLSYLGFTMNPVSFFYCYDPSGERLVAIIAEVNNTPWGEQHLYVVPSSSFDAKSAVRSGDIKKEFHVSPFLDLNMNYRMSFSLPRENLAVRIENRPLESRPDTDDSNSTQRKVTSASKSRKNFIDVTMLLERRPMTSSALNWLLIKYPAISFKVFLGIYWNALLLYLKNIPFVPHPNKRNKDQSDPPPSLAEGGETPSSSDNSKETNRNEPEVTSAKLNEQKVLVS